MREFNLKFSITLHFFELFISSLLLTTTALSQSPVFTRKDTLRGAYSDKRNWWDLTFYHLSLSVNPSDSSIQGNNKIFYKVIRSNNVMQIDLQEPMQILSIKQNNKSLSYKKEGDAYFVTLQSLQKINELNILEIEFKGKPTVSKNPPWSGGFTWKKDANGIDFIATSCQGDGASIWWPCKDHPLDEPDSMLQSYTVPAHLTAVGNGRLFKTDSSGNYKTYHWKVKNPINNYGVNINIGDYFHFSEKYTGEKGILDCEYYVLKVNKDKAIKQFEEVKKMLKAFEHWFGPYPFYEDSYKLVEVPYLGMEHQSSVTYGNKFQNGYLGKDLSESGWGLKFDFIIIHESGHEWFANNITNKDVADMWIHESFTAYSENLFLDYYYGKEASADYVIGTRTKIINDRPIIGLYNLNYEGSSDMYYKGANILHTLRQVTNNDSLWRVILRGLNQEFYHQTVSSEQIENYFTKMLHTDLSSFFNQYLRSTTVPVLEYYINKNVFYYRWTNSVKGFDMPVKITLNNTTQIIEPKTYWKKLALNTDNCIVKVDKNYYIGTMNTTGK